jgi:hypothetical protein
MNKFLGCSEEKCKEYRMWWVEITIEKLTGYPPRRLMVSSVDSLDANPSSTFVSVYEASSILDESLSYVSIVNGPLA